MNWIIENWSLLVVLIAVVILVYIWVKKFVALPNEEQVKRIKQWMLIAVIEAEKRFGEKTGKLKLSWVYAEFVKAFPSLVAIMPFELFSDLVDSVLDDMREILEKNENAKKYVYGE